MSSHTATADTPHPRMSSATPPRTGILFVLSGPSGVGKDAAIRSLKENPAFTMHHVVTATTRRMRANEQHGRDYWFYTLEQFQEMEQAGKLLEWAVVHDNYYGTPLTQVREQLAQGADVLLKIDVQGAAKVKERAPDGVFIFLAPPSVEALVSRLRQRKTETPQELEVRVANAYREMDALSAYDYCVVNHDDRLDDAVSKISAIIQAERCRVQRRVISF